MNHDVRSEDLNSDESKMNNYYSNITSKYVMNIFCIVERHHLAGALGHALSANRIVY